MTTRVESRISHNISPLYPDLIEHFHKIQKNLSEALWSKQWEFKRLLESLEVMPVHEVLQMGQEQTMMRVGKRLRRPEGLIYQIVNEEGNTTLVKFFDGAGVEPSVYAPTLLKLFPRQTRERRIFGVHYTSADPVPVEALEVLESMSHDDRGAYFASAEVLVRTYAHHAAPETMPLPVVIVHDWGQAVGFTLPLKSPVVRTVDPYREETFFDIGTIGYK